MVPGAGFEPARYRYHWILNPTCLPVSPPGHLRYGLVFYLKNTQTRLNYFAEATASFSFLPTLNLTALVAGTSTTLSVPGTRAVLAALSLVVNVPNPIKLTLLPSTSASSITSSAASIVAAVSFLESPVSPRLLESNQLFSYFTFL